MNVVACLLVVTLIEVAASHIPKYASVPHVASFSKFIKLKDDILVGSKNHLFTYSMVTLTYESVTIGPVNSSNGCHPDGFKDCSDVVLTDVVVKVLTPLNDNASILLCYNVLFGRCEVRDVSSLQTVKRFESVLVANDVQSSAVAVIASGPGNKDVLYLASTVAKREVGRDNPGYDYYSVSTRHLYGNSSFKLLDSIYEASAIKFLHDKIQFRVTYLYGFSSHEHVYFVTNQPVKPAAASEEARLIRICKNDTKYRSYSEMKLVCQEKYKYVRAVEIVHVGSNLARILGLRTAEPFTDSEHVMFAVMSERKNSTTSVLCQYTLRLIRKRFTEDIKECFRGVGNIELPQFKAVTACKKKEVDISDSYCGAEDNYPFAGRKPITEHVLVDIPSVVTAIAITQVENHTVAFVGTAEGSMKKIAVYNGTFARIYETVNLKGSGAVLDTILFDQEKKHVFVLKESTLAKVAVANCSRYTDCEQCILASDPYCGWCSMQFQCKLKSECEKSQLANRWLDYTSDECPRIRLIQPEQIAISPNSPADIQLTVEKLPVFQQAPESRCLFRSTHDTRTSESTASASDGKIECTTPAYNNLPPIPTGADHVTMHLTLIINSQSFVSSNLSFFDCSQHQSCSPCVSSRFPCTWCVQSHKCTSNREICSREDKLITSRSVPGNSDSIGQGVCPRIEDSATEVEIASGSSRQIVLKVVSLFPFQESLQCVFRMWSVVIVQATLSNADLSSNVSNLKLLKCDSVQFDYVDAAAFYRVPLEVQWWSPSGWKSLDNPNDIQVSIYKCEPSATNCGVCHSLRNECGWCTSDSLCRLRKNCKGSADDFLDYHKHCTDLSITSFLPVKGPFAGGTELMIRGTNLGKSTADIEGGIFINNIRCVREKYNSSELIFCVTGNASGLSDAGSSSGAVTVRVNGADSKKGVSLQSFNYVMPRVEDVQPGKGPISGGTLVNITGSNLDAGVRLLVMLHPVNDSQKAVRTCVPRARSSTSITCVVNTKKENLASSEYKANVLVNLDDALIPVPSAFEFLSDPSVDGVVPAKALLGGHTFVNVSGVNLHLSQQPQIFIIVDGSMVTRDCVKVADGRLRCPTPSLSSELDLVERNHAKLEFGFVFDSVTKKEASRIEIYSDPVFFPFPNRVKDYQGPADYLTINGEHLNHVLNTSDVQVLVDSHRCNVTALTLTQLTCRVPYQAVGAKPVVRVLYGSEDIELGQLEMGGALLSKEVWIGVAAAFLALIIIICVYISYKRKTRQNTQVMKRMQNQMDVLEARVAKECKEAFAELQTDMTEITSDLDGYPRIPFRSYRSFCLRVLFPNMRDDEHIVSQPLDLPSGNAESVARGLYLFNQLICNKTFLLAFIRTLEGHRDFSMRDRVTVASLLSVCLQPQMEYQTDLLKTLLTDLIERSMESNSHPKLLLRRTESIAEKMLTNWFTFLLYRFLRERAGEPLFTLYRAIKQQVDKGPVDALTSEARYSLSEDKLIRQQIDYTGLTLLVLDPDEQQCGARHMVRVLDLDEQRCSARHTVRVLDCDTVSQAKEKILDAIYRNAPYSSRPDKDDMDLDWLAGSNGRQTLQDEDASTKSDGELRRLNTLRHYNVTDGSLMALMHRQPSFCNYNSLSKSNHHYASLRFDNNSNSSPSLTRSLSPTTVQVDLEHPTGKYYHLVKGSDSQKEGERGSKMVSEIYLTRLLSTKGTLQQFVDDLFESIFSIASRSSVLPLAIKYMFDFLDDQARQHCIFDHEVVHTWKSNSLPLRFWINIVKNPDFVFDIRKSNIVDSCLSVCAQTFMDSCSISELRLGKDSPSSKLLYARDIPKYKGWVERYYQDVKNLPPISEQDMSTLLADESRSHVDEFNTEATLYELYKYVNKYRDSLMETLENDEFAGNHRLPRRLEQVHQCMEGDT